MCSLRSGLHKKYAQLFKDVYTAQSVVTNASLVLWAVGGPTAALALGLLLKWKVWDPRRRRDYDDIEEGDGKGDGDTTTNSADIAGLAQA